MFFEFGIKDFVDILLVAMILYYIYRLMRESRSLNVFVGIMVFVITWLVFFFLAYFTLYNRLQFHPPH